MLVTWAPDTHAGRIRLGAPGMTQSLVLGRRWVVTANGAEAMPGRETWVVVIGVAEIGLEGNGVEADDEIVLRLGGGL